MKSNYFFTVIGLLVLLSGCQLQRNILNYLDGKTIERIKKRSPNLFDSDTSFITKKDTIVVIQQEERFDTTVLAADSVVIVNDRFITQLKVVRDTLTKQVVKYRIKTIILADTVLVERIDTVFTIDTEIITKTITETKRVIPWWLWVVALISILFFIWHIRYFIILVKRDNERRE